MAFGPLLSTPDLLSRPHYGDQLVSIPAEMHIPDDVAATPNERLGRYFERLVQLGIASLNPLRQHSRVQIIHDKHTRGELDMLFQLSGEAVTHHWEIAIKYYLKVGAHFVGLRGQDRLDLKLKKLFDHQLRLCEDPVTRAHVALLGYPPSIQSRAWVKGMLFYPWGVTPSFPDEVSADHARGVWSRGFPAPYRDNASRWVMLPKLSWLVPFSAKAPTSVSGAEAAVLSEAEPHVMWARVERARGLWVERERLCVVNQEWVTRTS